MSEWFVEASAISNEVVAQFLAQHSVTEAESMYYEQLCADGKKRDVWRIPGHFVKRFRSALVQFPHLKLSFYTRSSPGARLSKADFILQKKKSVPIKRAEAAIVHAKEKRLPTAP